MILRKLGQQSNVLVNNFVDLFADVYKGEYPEG